MKQITVIFIIIIFASSCNISHNSVNLISVNPGQTEHSPDSFFDKGYTITLETTKENLIAKIDKIEMTDSKLYILDKRKNTINIFDKKGFYVSTINKMGQGPNEYTYISDFAVSDSLIYILSRANKKIFVYNNSGIFSRSYKLDDYYDYFYLNGNDIFLYSNYSNNGLFNIILSKIDNDKITPTNKLLPFIKNQNFSYSPSPFNANENGDLLLCQQFDNSIYSLEKKSIINKYKVEFNTKEKIPTDFEKIGFAKIDADFANKSVVTRISYVQKNKNSIYLLYKFEYNKYLTRVDTKTLVTKTLKLELNKNYPFIFCESLGFYNNSLVGYLSADNVLYFDKKFKSDKNKNNILTRFDNPVLFFYKLK